MLYLNKFKRLLLSNSILCFLFLFIIIYIWIFTGIIKYSSKLNNETNLEGKIIAYSLKEDRLSLTIKSTETVLVNYYIKNSPEKEYLRNIIGYG